MSIRAVASASFLSGLLLPVALMPGPGPIAFAAEDPPPALSLEERIEQSLSTRGRELRYREDRRSRVRVRVPLSDLPPLDGDSLLGMRVGSLAIEAALGSDPRWRPGRAQATLHLLSGTPEDPQEVTLRARWSRGELRAELRARGRAPLAETLSGGNAGDVGASIDAAARLGSLRWRFGGEAAGDLDRTTVPLPGDPVDLVRLSLAGSARVLADAEDDAPPAVVIEAPTGPTVPTGSLDVTGTLRDDRTLTRLTWAIGGGPETDAIFAADPETGFLGEIAGDFSFSIPVTAGLAHLTLRAYDAAGNSGADTADFLVSTPRTIILGAGEGAVSATTSTGGLVAWGWRSFGPNWTTGLTKVATPTPVAGISDVAAVAEGSLFTLVLKTDGTIVSWGRNTKGQLGDGTIEHRTAPAPVQGLDQVVAIAAGTDHSLALRADGTVWLWGATNGVEPGNHGYRTLPAQVTGIPPMKAIAASAYSSYALDEDGVVWEWNGAGYVMFATPPAAGPHALPGLPKTSTLAAGMMMVVGVAEDGSVWAVGKDWYNYGILGGASAETGWVVPGISGATSVACGNYHTLVLLQDGTLMSFGNNFGGQLGDGTTTNRPAPVPVPALSGVASIVATYASSYAVMDDGTLRGWGYNYYGSVGDGTYVDRPEPVVVTLP